MNVRERHETQCHVESGVFIVPLIVMVIYIYIYIYIYTIYCLQSLAETKHLIMKTSHLMCIEKRNTEKCVKSQQSYRAD